MAFPVANAGLFVHHGRTLVNTDAVGDASPAFFCAIALLAFFLTAAMFVEFAALFFIMIYAKTNPFMADGDALFSE